MTKTTVQTKPETEADVFDGDIITPEESEAEAPKPNPHDFKEGWTPTPFGLPEADDEEEEEAEERESDAPDKPAFKWEGGADALLGVADLLMTMGLEPLAKKKFTKDERAEADRLSPQHQRANFNEWTERQKNIMWRYDAMQDYLKGIPMTEKERAAARPSLEAILDKHGQTIPPEIAFVLVMGGIAFSRYAGLQSF
jgi:hypothetical protein